MVASCMSMPAQACNGCGRLTDGEVLDRRNQAEQANGMLHGPGDIPTLYWQAHRLLPLWFALAAGFLAYLAVHAQERLDCCSQTV